MLEGALVREIKDPFKKEEMINPFEIKVYLDLLKKKQQKPDNTNEIAEDLFNQLMDKKTN